MSKITQESLAKQQIESFVERFDSSYRALVYHAALPFVLTPELLNYLRIQFLAGETVWVAEVDFLLSDLCQPVGYELYVMKTDIRAYALKQLRQEFGASRMQAVARRLINYVRYLAKNNPFIGKQELQAQQWAAMVYLEDERENAVKEIAQEFSKCVSSAQQKRLARIVQELEPQIQSHPELLAYAEEVTSVLRTQTTVEAVETVPLEVLQSFNLQLFPVEVATIIFEREEELLNLEFETVFVNNRGEIIQTLPCSAYYYKESLDIKNRNEDGLKSFVGNDDIKSFVGNDDLKSEVDNNDRESEPTQTVEPLTMIYIPEGELIMGSHSDEKDRYDDETPQHRVKIAPFYMSQTPITQAQWRAIASLPQVERELNPNPSQYEGDENPVENIDWGDAIEWCARLSIYTGREYRLPSEAEWEYACRGFETPPVIISDGEDIEGQNTINTKVYPPFHFGDTITDKLANYDASVTYADEPKGEDRSKTTPVRTFKPNAFGLYDMHGNVYEWCLDPWHSDYNGAPSDGRVWDEENQQEDYYQDIVKNIKQLLTDERNRVIRGGSYVNSPRYCRSAFRNYFSARGYDYGLRVVCGLPRT
ncbi:formylglycine-generating enzyme family protein [Crocosphaera sp. XPORK-15E]|uniref:formylglycine-generating enzyme family protein n=1 Tax=Crocosphaera sp. XPORK-15E TaxID=3110247 RepID=UPI002B2049FC|nr:formylglycine-generating enzyme family protein [Crocosphaera sp. XPORK-15E]MEA5537035.1 formylglycine-generating enzyme family protein [Crocosphaera sp. XPORK-15E]